MYDHGRTSLEWYKTAVGWHVGLSTSAIAALLVLMFQLQGSLENWVLWMLVPMALFGFAAMSGVLLQFHVIDRIGCSERLEDADKRVYSMDVAEREKAEQEAEKERTTLESKRSRVQRFHRYCVIGFHMACLSCVAVGLGLAIGLQMQERPEVAAVSRCWTLPSGTPCTLLRTPGGDTKVLVRTKGGYVWKSVK